MMGIPLMEICLASPMFILFFFAAPKFFDSAQKKQSFDSAQEAPGKNYSVFPGGSLI